MVSGEIGAGMDGKRWRTLVQQDAMAAEKVARRVLAFGVV
jgi:hypothetical protein